MSWSCFWVFRTVFLLSGSGNIVCGTDFGAAMSVWEEGVHSDGMLGGINCSGKITLTKVNGSHQHFQ